MDKDQLFEEIIKSNEEMLSYFTNKSNQLLRSVQNYQTELFEINIRLDELYRTKNVYYPSTNSRKNVFSPLMKMNEKDEKDSELTSQIEDLKLVKKTLENKLAEEENAIRAISAKLSSLISSQHCLCSFPAILELISILFTKMKRNMKALNSSKRTLLSRKIRSMVQIYLCSMPLIIHTSARSWIQRSRPMS